MDSCDEHFFLEGRKDKNSEWLPLGDSEYKENMEKLQNRFRLTSPEMETRIREECF